MGRISRIEEVVNSTISSYAHTKIFPRGLPVYLDSLLRGSTRFAKRTGNNIAVINPNNTFSFTTLPSVSDTVVQLVNPSGIVINSILSIGPGKELLQVSDVINNNFLITNPIKVTPLSTDKCLLYAVPIIVAETASKGTTTITVKCNLPLTNGDIFVHLYSQDLLQSLTEIKTTQVSYLGTTTDINYPNLYRLSLISPLTVALNTNTITYIRAFPAYFSQVIPIPNATFTSEPLGPFLLDFLSGNLLEGNAFGENLSVRLLNRSNEYIFGDVGTYVSVDKNAGIFNRPWSSAYPMFWDVAEGHIKLSSNRCHFFTNDKKVFCAGIRCIPFIEVPNDLHFRISLKSNEDCSLRIIFNPNSPQEINLTAGATSTFTITLSSSTPVENVEINILSSTNTCEVQMTDWSLVEGIVTSIQYNIMIEAIGQATYNATGMILKPYFLGSELLKGTYDSGITFDGGRVYL